MTTTFDEPATAAQPTDPRQAPADRPSVAERAALAVLLVGTAVMYLWNITIDGMGNQFYAGAAQAGSKDWEALLFGSLDSANFITVDKPPVSQWVMGLFGQVFGFSSASMLVPQALMAVGTVALLYAAVTRISGRQAGLLAGAALALTPVAALMFRFNNPDAVMVLLMMAGAYCTVRALEHDSARWLAWAGVALGFAFLAKMLEGLMVMPALGVAYLLAAPTSIRRRLLHLAGAVVALLVSSGWFVLLTLIWPASSRPYIAGSTDDNFMNLVLGYNGFARVLGKNHFGGGGPGAHHVVDTAAGANAAPGHGGGFGGFGADQAQGLPRLVTGEFGFEIGWLVPAALLALALVIVSRGRAPRTDLVRAGAVVFGGWLLIDGLVLSFMKSMVHPYYSLSIAPAVAGMFAIGVQQMWQRRDSRLWRLGLAALILTAGGWGWWTLGRNTHWLPALRWAVLVLTVVAAVALLVPALASARRWAAPAALALGLIAGVAAPAAYAFSTIGTAHQGGGPTVGPATQNGHGGPWGQSKDDPQLDALLEATHTEWSAAIDRSSAAAGLELTTNTAVMAIGGFGGSDPTPTLSQFISYVDAHRVGYYLTKADDPGSGPPRSGQHDDIADWVAKHFTPKTVGSTMVYDLSTAH